MQKRNKITLTLVSAILALLAIIYLVYWFSNSTKSVLYVEVQSVDFDLTGSRFVIDGFKVGSLKLSSGNQNVYKIDLDQQVHIPVNSEYFLMKDGQSRIFIDVMLKSSDSYLNSGDTIYNVQIGPDIPRAILISQKEEIEVDPVSGDIKEVENSDEVPVIETAAEPHEKMEIRLQIFASKARLPMNSPKFKNQKGIKEFEEDGWFKYYFGPYDSLEEANAKRKQITEAGFKDSYIVAYRGNNRISLSELRK